MIPLDMIVQQKGRLAPNATRYTTTCSRQTFGAGILHWARILPCGLGFMARQMRAETISSSRPVRAVVARKRFVAGMRALVDHKSARF